MDVFYDIDGTLAKAGHRLHFIEKEPKDWDAFLSDDQMAMDTAIPETWEILTGLLGDRHARIIFITGRPEKQRQATVMWLLTDGCKYRRRAFTYWDNRLPGRPALYMRQDNDRRPSHIVKEEGLMRARADGFNPTLVFEDRKLDAEMWRRNGLLCCQVAEGNY